MKEKKKGGFVDEIELVGPGEPQIELHIRR